MNIYTKLFYSGTALLGVLHLGLPSKSLAMNPDGDSGDAKTSAVRISAQQKAKVDVTKLSIQQLGQREIDNGPIIVGLRHTLFYYYPTTEEDKAAMELYKLIDADFMIARNNGTKENVRVKKRNLLRAFIRKGISADYEAVHQELDEMVTYNSLILKELSRRNKTAAAPSEKSAGATTTASGEVGATAAAAPSKKSAVASTTANGEVGATAAAKANTSAVRISAQQKAKADVTKLSIQELEQLEIDNGPIIGNLRDTLFYYYPTTEEDKAAMELYKLIDADFTIATYNGTKRKRDVYIKRRNLLHAFVRKGISADYEAVHQELDEMVAYDSLILKELSKRKKTAAAPSEKSAGATTTASGGAGATAAAKK